MKKSLELKSDVRDILKSTKDFTQEDTWRVFRIMAEFVESFETLSKLGPAVSIFGSSRLPPSNAYYKKAIQLGKKLVDADFAVITGGGPGIMEAANKGAKEVGGHSIGLNIELPFQEPPNDYLTTQIRFHYFFVRKVSFIKYACAFVIFPGGFGTYDELFESLNLVSTEHITRFPIILVGSDYWKNLIAWLKDNVRLGTLLPRHLKMLKVIDDLDEIVEVIKKSQSEQNEELEEKGLSMISIVKGKK